jgi:hypothetical protein
LSMPATAAAVRETGGVAVSHDGSTRQPSVKVDGAIAYTAVAAAWLGQGHMPSTRQQP